MHRSPKCLIGHAAIQCPVFISSEDRRNYKLMRQLIEGIATDYDLNICPVSRITHVSREADVSSSSLRRCSINTQQQQFINFPRSYKLKGQNLHALRGLILL